MCDFGPHVVDVEWLREVVFVVRERHRLEIESHHCSALDIANFIVARSGVHIGVEELGNASAVLWDIRVLSALVPFLVVVDDMVGLGSEEF